jgi:hypothetical protein
MAKDIFLKKVNNVKREILEEIRNILGHGTHMFKDTFFIHYIEGEIATTEVCIGVKVAKNGEVIIICQSEEEIDGTAVLLFDTNSLGDILDHLIDEARNEYTDDLREIIKNNGDGGVIDFEDDFVFTCNPYIGRKTNKIFLAGGNVYISSFLGCNFTEIIIKASSLHIVDLINLVKHVKNRQNFDIKIYASRIFSINAPSYEEALAIAKNEFKMKPFDEGDIDDISVTMYPNGK